MMKKALQFILLTLLSLPLFAITSSIKTAEVTAYKYINDDIFDTAVTPELNLEIRDASGAALNEGGEIKIPASAVDKETQIFDYVITGNYKTPITLTFTFSPLSTGTHAVVYEVSFSPTTSTISNQDFESKTVSIPHYDSGNSYLFKYRNSYLVSGDGITVSTQSGQLIIQYTTSVTTTPTGCPSFNRIDHWVRKGEIAVSIPSANNSGLPAGRYTGPLYAVLTSGG
jgi:hypothetical protein